MKKKIIAVLAAVLLLGVSSVAYAAPATNCLEYANAQKNVLGISNSLYDALQNCNSNVAGLNLVCSLPDSGDSVTVNGVTCSSNQLSTLLAQAKNCANAAADAKTTSAGANNSANANANSSAVESAAKNAANNTCNTASNVSDVKTVLNELRQQAVDNVCATTGTNAIVINGTNLQGAKFSSTLSDLLKKLMANGSCPTAKPTATPVVTETPAATAKPTATPVVTNTPAATAKPTATPVVTETPAATAKPTAAPTATVKPTLPSGGDNLSYEEQVLELVNEQRAANGLNPLTLSSKLSDMARLKSQDMHDNNYFSHTSPTYGSPFDMMKTFGISYRTAGENIAMGYSTPEAVMNGWMNSPGHRANILNANYTTLGVGYVASGHYWTQEFIG